MTASSGAARLIVMTAMTLILAACSSSGETGAPLSTASVTPGVATAPAKPRPIKVALLLPLAGFGEAAVVAKAMKQAAELALFAQNDPSIQLIVKDDGGTPDRARQAAEAAIADGAGTILGPLYGHSALAAAPAAAQKARPMLAFSNDARAAAPGLWLMGYLPDQETRRVVAYAFGKGKKRFAALVPQTEFGRAADIAFRDAVAKAGGEVVAVESYAEAAFGAAAPLDRIKQAIAAGQGNGRPIDALFVPTPEVGLRSLATAIARAGISSRDVQILGTGGFDSDAAMQAEALNGAWFAGSDPGQWRAFAMRFRSTFGTEPPRLAVLAYDAVAIAVAVERETQLGAPLMPALTRPQGFAGAGGSVRFRSDGATERSFAVLQVAASGPVLIDPAPSFVAEPPKTASAFSWNW